MRFSPSTALSRIKGAFDLDKLRELLHAAVANKGGEARWSADTIKRMRPVINQRLTQGKFRMVLPPPNVTGKLHLGHALTVTIEDSFCRYHRQLGEEVVWYPGFDHAGIATQSMVEKALMREQGKLRRDVSTEEFLQQCEQWKDKRIKEISSQLNSLGCRLDWSHRFYTMDGDFSRTVAAAFCQLHSEGLIFRAERLINWCPVLESSVSDQEVEEVNGEKVCSRSGGKIVPLLKEQWFLDCKEIYADVLKALRRGEIRLRPDSAEAQMVEWLSYTEPWCLSRQLLWGHRVPAYRRRGEKEYVVAESREEALKKLHLSSADADELEQDGDVLDTWFSASLIPLRVAGWPSMQINGQVLDCMETGHDIIGFWVARMLAVGRRITGHFPFTNVVLHGMIRDSQNRKMSKSLGNVIDPMDIINGISLPDMLKRIDSTVVSSTERAIAEIDLKKRFPKGIPQCGADSLRFAFLKHKLMVHDLPIDVVRVSEEGLRFCNKMWNMMIYAGRLFEVAASMKSEGGEANEKDTWIEERLEETKQLYFHHMDDFEPHAAFEAVFLFLLNDLCGNYLESTKVTLREKDPARLLAIAPIFHRSIKDGLEMLSIFMPQLSECLLAEIYQAWTTQSGGGRCNVNMLG